MMPAPSPTIDTGQERKGEGSEGQDTTLDTSQFSQAIRHTSVTADTNSPRSSAPTTPGLNVRTPTARRTSQPATSPISSNVSPRPPHSIRRTSSSQNLNRPPSSPQLLRKASRTSLGGATDDQQQRPTPKRSLSNLIAGLREAQSPMEPIEEPIPLTAAQIATDHFTRELVGQSQAGVDAETVVILHDACYGHRYSRLKATKTTLSMIVERPERIHASVLGASTAYVRLGEHHAGGKRAPHPSHRHDSTPPFEIRRSGRSMDVTSSYVTNVHGTSWMSELREMCHSAQDKLAAGVKELTRVPTPGEAEKQTLHEGDLYLAPESLHAFQGALGGVADAIDAVFAAHTATKRAFVAVRPPGHHCSADMPSGFCWLNNVHVGIEYAAQTYGLTHAAILDFDLHHGDGSQAITWERNSKNNEKRLNAKANSKLKLGPDIGYYSIHDINSYPCEMGDDEKVQAASLCIENAHGQSIWNVHLQTWKTEDEFWRLYEERYSILLHKARNFLEHHDRRLKLEGKSRPQSAIFISAGFDASEWEGSGMQRHKVNVPTEFYARFTRDVVELSRSVQSCEDRVISVLEGGYSDRALCTGVLSHLSGLCVSPVTATTNGVGSLMEQMNGLSINGLSIDRTLNYDKDWWSAANMTALENKVNPPPPPQAKKGRSGPQPTYATPTESFAYKVVDPHKFARSVSGTMREATVPARPPTPPPPEVDWIVATQELSKLLIPTDRQTKSCTPEELAVVRTKKERQSAMPVMSTEQAGQPRQLRDRKAKGPVYAESAHSDETGSVRAVSRAESRSSRRETIDVLPSEATPAMPRRLSRRLSAGSALGFASSPVDVSAPPVPSIPSAQAVTSARTMKPPPIPPPKTQPDSSKLQAPAKPRKVTGPGNPPSSSTALNGARTAGSDQPADASGGAKPYDLDSLTSGMKKITLKVSTTKEEHDRKQKEKIDAERRARALKAAETRRVNAAAKKAAKDASTRLIPGKDEPPLPAVPTQADAAALEASALVLAPTVEGAVFNKQAELHQSNAPSTDMLEPSERSRDTATTECGVRQSTVAPSVNTHAAPTTPPETLQHNAFPSLAPPAEDFQFPEHTNSNGSGSVSPSPNPDTKSSPDTSAVSGRASTAPSSSPGVQQDAQDHLPHFTADRSNPTSNLPDAELSNAHDRRPLPVWSSTGPIPFAAAATSSPPKQQVPDARSAWEVPDTPANH